MRLRRRRYDWRSSSVSPVQPGLRDHFIHYLVTRRRRGSQRRLAHLVVVVLVATVLVLLVVALGLSVLRRSLLLLLARRSRNPAQIADSRFNLVHQADVFVITDHTRLGGVIRLG